MKCSVFVSLFAIVGLAAHAPASTIPGDLNGDMVVDLADYLVYQRQLAGEPCVPRTEGRAGRNGDPCFNPDDLAAFESLIQGNLNCEDLTECGVTSPDQCLWKPFHDAIKVNDCSLLVGPTFDAVDRRMCELGILMDGDLSAALGSGSCVFPGCGPGCPSDILAGVDRGVAHVDRVTNPGEDPGPDGTGESPFRPGDPSGFNIGCSILWFVPDHDAADGVDTSFLYVGWDIAAFNPKTGATPVQYDADGDGSACRSLRPVLAPEFASEFYAAHMTACADLSGYDPTNRNTNGVFEFATRDMLVRMNNPGPTTLWTQIEASRFSPVLILDPKSVTRSFPTADGDLLANDGTNAGGEPCIDAEVIACTGKCSGNGDPCSNVCSGDAARRCRRDEDCDAFGAGVCVAGSDCPMGEVCDFDGDLRNNVELVFKQVETSGLFGPHTGKACNISGQPCRRNADCPGGESCSVAAPIAPDSERARQNRFALAQLTALLRGDTDGDDAPEESAVVAQFTPLPDIEVSKLVRCADEGESEFTEGPIDALIGSTVEYEIRIQNLGNVDLEVTLEDVLAAAGAQADFAACDVVCDFIQAELTSPRRGLADEPVNPANALDLGLVGGFFIPSCDPPVAEVSFLESIQTGSSAVLGTLLGAELVRNKVCSETPSQLCENDVDCPDGQTCEPLGACQFTEGDSIVIRFRATVGTTDRDEFCSAFEPVDCANAITVEGTLVGDSEVVAKDEANTIDTEREILDGADDNVATVNILCRDITFMKAVGFPDEQGSFVTGAEVLSLPSVPPAGFVDMEYLYIVDNIGETDESITISDPELCSDVSDTMAAFPGGIAFVDCGLCTVAPVGSVGPILLGPGDGMHAESCLIRFNSQAAMRHFLALDNDREPCNEKDPGLSGDDCYRNCATASAVATNLGEICRPPNEAIIRDSFTTVCNSQCELEVRKQVRCLPDCDPESLSGEEGWVEDPSQLDVAPGACVEYRIITTNLSPEDVLLCALKYNDVMSGAVNFQSGPTDVSISRNCSNLDFSTAFNWLGDDVLCLLESPLAKNDSVVVRFQAQLKPADEVELNVKLNNDVLVLGASENDCPEQGEPSFSCMDRADVDIETLGCDFELTKDVTCDDPRDPEAVFTADIVDALPGSKVGFRIRVENTGKVNLPRINITEDLSCSTWFEAGSVVADIDGSDVLACICPGGCNSIGALGGMKDLSGCGGFSPGELLTITFEVKVPAMFNMMGTGEDCLNTVTVTAETDSCSSDEKDPCPEREDFARINVDVPRIVCDKEVCADPDDIEGCDNGFSEIVEIDGADANYPLSIIYKLSATNTGETDLINARICDPDLIDDLTSLGAGVEIGPCAINPATGCASLGMLAPGASQMATCEVKFLTEMAWFEFAGRDDDRSGDCYTNTSRAFADVDPSDYCTREAGLDVQSTDCEAKVCVGMSRIPTMSEWGLVILALLLLVAYKIHFGGRRVQPA
jgi:hypothetical protein